MYFDPQFHTNFALPAAEPQLHASVLFGETMTKWSSHDRWTEKHDEVDRINHLAVTHRSNNLEVRVRAIETTVVKYTSISAVTGSVLGSAITGIIVYYLTTGGPA